MQIGFPEYLTFTVGVIWKFVERPFNSLYCFDCCTQKKKKMPLFILLIVFTLFIF
jgi:hypothetical protein